MTRGVGKPRSESSAARRFSNNWRCTERASIPSRQTSARSEPFEESARSARFGRGPQLRFDCAVRGPMDRHLLQRSSSSRVARKHYRRGGTVCRDGREGRRRSHFSRPQAGNRFDSRCFSPGQGAGPGDDPAPSLVALDECAEGRLREGRPREALFRARERQAASGHRLHATAYGPRELYACDPNNPAYRPELDSMPISLASPTRE